MRSKSIEKMSVQEIIRELESTDRLQTTTRSEQSKPGPSQTAVDRSRVEERGVQADAVQDTVEQLQEAAAEQELRDIDFKVLPEEDVIQVRVKNDQTDELIRAIPPNEVIELRKRVEAFVGLLVDIHR